MPYSSKIKTLENSYNLVNVQIETLIKSENKDEIKLQKLYETKNDYLTQLRELRRLQYEASQIVEIDNDR